MPNHHENDLTAVLVQGSRLKAAPAGHCIGGVPTCQAERRFDRRYGAAFDEAAEAAGARPPLSPR
jgi:hypothetical protein